MNDEVVNIIFDELKLCKSKINELEKNLENLKNKQNVLKESVCFCRNNTSCEIPESLRSLAFHAFKAKQFSPLIERYIKKYKFFRFEFLNVAERAIIPVIIIPSIPEIPGEDDWVKNKRKEVYNTLYHDLSSTYYSDVSFGKFYTYVTCDKIYKTSQEFLMDVASHVNISNNNINIKHQIIINGTIIGFTFDFGGQLGHDNALNEIFKNAGILCPSKHEWINESPLKTMYIALKPREYRPPRC